MRSSDDRYVKARQLVSTLVKQNWPRYRDHRNVVGLAYGRREAHGERTDEPAMVVYVIRKIPERFLAPGGMLPRRMFVGGDSVEVDIVETGPLTIHSFTARERPTTHGISIAHFNVTAGTLGCVLIDNTDGAQVILSNNHVLANKNLASIGDAIVQPGPFDGGMNPADRIGTLRRFVNVNATGNRVDCAIAIPDKASDVSDAVHNNIITTANRDHPAIGLLFAGGCNRTVLNPITDVLSQLNCSMPAGATAVATVDVGDNVEKVGRTSEYTSSTVKEVDVTTQIDYSDARDGSDLRSFDGQIATAWMSDPGDSGSLVYRGGKGGDESHCSCGTTSAGEALLGVPLRTESAMAKDVRDKFLRQTKIGHWAVDLFYRNEEHFLERFRATTIKDDDREHAHKLFVKFGDDARRAFIDGLATDQKVTEQHLREARQSLERAIAYMTPAEVEAAKHLFQIASERTKGRGPRELLAMLNDEELFEQVKRIVAKVPSVKTKDDC